MFLPSSFSSSSSPPSPLPTPLFPPTPLFLHLKKKYLICILCTWVFCAVYVTFPSFLPGKYMPAWGGKLMVLELLKLDLEINVSFYMSWDETWGEG